jgi:hypothetical protein
MATRIQQFQVLQNPAFQQQLASCLLFAAINVLAEDAGTANHVNRVKWANAIVLSPLGQAATVLNYTMTNPTIAAAAGNAPGPSGTPFADSDIDFVVASLFDKFATQFAGQ